SGHAEEREAGEEVGARPLAVHEGEAARSHEPPEASHGGEPELRGHVERNEGGAGRAHSGLERPARVRRHRDRPALAGHGADQLEEPALTAAELQIVDDEEDRRHRQRPVLPRSPSRPAARIAAGRTSIAHVTTKSQSVVRVAATSRNRPTSQSITPAPPRSRAGSSKATMRPPTMPTAESSSAASARPRKSRSGTASSSR